MGILDRQLKEPGSEHITWMPMEDEVADLLCCCQSHVFHVRNHFETHKELPIVDTSSGRGAASDKFDRDKISSITSDMLIEIAKFVDDTHSKGASVTNKKVRAYIKVEFNVVVTRSSVQRAMKRLGLTWRPSKPRARTLGAFRLEAIHNFLIKLDEYVREMESTTNSPGTEGSCRQDTFDQSEKRARTSIFPYVF
jgi:hypothetical protein